MMRFGAMAVLALVVVGSAPGAEGPTEKQIHDAIERGVGFLVNAQGDDGTWEYRFNHNHRLGITSLAGLALLENGVPGDEPVIRKAAEAVRRLGLETDLTYDSSLAILFLSRLQATGSGSDDRLIADLAGRLAAAERQGMWSYNVPVDGRRTEGRGSVLENLFAGAGDNSNTQFAILGVWAAGRHGFDVEPALAAVDQHFRSTQSQDGRWGYQAQGDGSEAMTCAGVMGLAIAAARPSEADRMSSRARGARLAADPLFQRAMANVGRDARRFSAASDIYHLWSVERVCVALGLTRLDGFDWYARGAEVLLAEQTGDGSWPEVRWGQMPNTCLALLFLRKSNLAFELERVLRLPGKVPEGSGNPWAEAPAPVAEEAEGTAGDQGVRVVVRGSDERAFPEITLDFEVKRADGTPVLDARAGDFLVRESGREVPVLRFQAPSSTEARPTRVVLVVDKSRSMIAEEDRMTPLRKAVATFLETLPRGSEVAVVAFSSDVLLAQPMTADGDAVRRAVDGLKPGGGTRYYDAVSRAIALLKNQNGRRAVLALTDGEDTFSHEASLEQVVREARAAGVPVHTLGVGSEEEIASDELKRLARETRGRYFPAQAAEGLRAIYEEVARGLGQSYSLTYHTDRRLADGTLRPVSIFYRSSPQASGSTEVFIPGMVVPAADWNRLFLALTGLLTVLLVVPGWLKRRARATGG